MEFSNIDLSPQASAALDQLSAEIDAGDMSLADAITAAQMLVRIDRDPQAARDVWIRLPGEPAIENVLAERVEAIAHIFVVVWEARTGLPAYIHDIGWEPRDNKPPGK